MVLPFEKTAFSPRIYDFGVSFWTYGIRFFLSFFFWKFWELDIRSIYELLLFQFLSL